MAHFAKIEDGIVRQVIVINNEVLLEDGVEKESLGAKFCAELFGGVWVQCSYNAKFRAKYPGSGDIYDAELDIFKSPGE